MTTTHCRVTAEQDARMRNRSSWMFVLTADDGSLVIGDGHTDRIVKVEG